MSTSGPGDSGAEDGSSGGSEGDESSEGEESSSGDGSSGSGGSSESTSSEDESTETSSDTSSSSSSSSSSGSSSSTSTSSSSTSGTETTLASTDTGSEEEGSDTTDTGDETETQGDTGTGMLGCTGNELLCEDFEGFGAGEIPSGGPWQPLGQSCEFQTAQFSMEVSGERANGGGQSLKIMNKHNPDCRLSGEFPQEDEFWLRAYLYWEPEIDTTDRETLAIDMTPGFVTSDDPAVRFGYRSKEPCTEHAGPQVTIIGIGEGEVTGCSSRELPRGEWYCFEAHVEQANGLNVRTYINGDALTYASRGKDETDSVSAMGTGSVKIDHVRLGIFTTGDAQGNIFVDDLAIATSRVGCAE